MSLFLVVVVVITIFKAYGLRFLSVNFFPPVFKSVNA